MTTLLERAIAVLKLVEAEGLEPSSRVICPRRLRA
jgi:hypothetical protein